MKIAKHICELVGVSAMPVSRWERGTPASLDALIRIALLAHGIGLSS
jgi:transcriptional regulator with XRE-family HTH domain